MQIRFWLAVFMAFFFFLLVLHSILSIPHWSLLHCWPGLWGICKYCFILSKCKNYHCLCNHSIFVVFFHFCLWLEKWPGKSFSSELSSFYRKCMYVFFCVFFLKAPCFSCILCVLSSFHIWYWRQGGCVR